jgi:hypothetical protein
MKRKGLIICAILLLAFSFPLTGCNDDSAPAESTPDNGEAAADAVDAGAGEAGGAVNISVTPPAGWEPVAGSVLPVQYLKGTASFMVKEEAFPGENIDAVVEKAKSSFESAFDNVQYVGEPEAVTVDGMDARKLIFTCEVSGMNMKYEYVYLFAGNDVYAITFGDLADSFDTLASDYETILGDITF